MFKILYAWFWEKNEKKSKKVRLPSVHLHNQEHAYNFTVPDFLP